MASLFVGLLEKRGNVLLGVLTFTTTRSTKEQI